MKLASRNSAVFCNTDTELRWKGSGGAGLGFSNQVSALSSSTLSLSFVDTVSQFEGGSTRSVPYRDLRISNKKGLLVLDGVRMSGLL
jgi:hypothetical protein